MSEFDLSASIASARDAVAKAAETYVAAQETMEAAASDLSEKQQKLKRLERALAILNGEEEPAPTHGARPDEKASAPAAVPAPPPPHKKPQPQGPFANMACGACGEVGRYSEQYRPTKAGTMARLLVCGECGNEQYLG